jgi:hypothetical protein
MTKDQEDQVFESIARHNPRFLDILKASLESEKTKLVTVVDPEQFKRLQGRAQFCQELLKRFEVALLRR